MTISDILQIADVVAREKNIEKEHVLGAMEEAMGKIGRAKYGQDNEIRATIDRQTGSISLFRYREVVDSVEDPLVQVGLAEAQKIDATLDIGQHLVDPLPPIDFGRMAAQTARQIISQRVREAERERQYHEFKDRISDIVSGVVKRVEFGHCVIDINRTEAVIKRDEMIPRENLRVGDRVRAYVMDVDPETRGPQVLLSRAHPQFMANLFKQEVPEIYDGVIQVVAVARDPGSRAKIAVRSRDNSIDPVGSCVGIRGSRVQAVVNELQGEKVDIILWSDDMPALVVNALAPAEITKVVYDEELGKVEVIVPEDQFSLAIGRRGQNVRLAGLLSGLTVSIVSEEIESSRRTEEFKKKSKIFIDSLDVDEVIAHLLIAEGFSSPEEVADSEAGELLDIEGFDEELASELQQRARDYIAHRAANDKAALDALQLDKTLLDFSGLSDAQKVAVSEEGVQTLDDLADLAGDELQEILGSDAMTLDAANKIIMDARAHWFNKDNA